MGPVASQTVTRSLSIEGFGTTCWMGWKRRAQSRRVRIMEPPFSWKLKLINRIQWKQVPHRAFSPIRNDKCKMRGYSRRIAVIVRLLAFTLLIASASAQNVVHYT